MRILRVGLVCGVLLAASACDSTQDSTPTSAITTASTSTTVADPTTSTADVVSTSDPSTTVSTPSTTQPPVTTIPANTSAPTTTDAPTPVDVKIYLLRGERLQTVHRQVPGPAVVRGALETLLAGPTDDERSADLISIVPDGTELLGVNLDDGLATVDLNSEFESGGGTLSMTARIAQVVFTATQFDNVDRVLFWLDGAPIEFLGGEGIILDEPQARSDVERAFTGGIIVDTPVYGAIVSSPFAVTGEGDVFEADFPIEVWADGVQIGGIAPVSAGAWGEWADFEATITLDAAPGPIELVAYDEGGCGIDPECPEIIKTVVPLNFTG